MKEAETLTENLPFAAKQTAYSNAAGIARIDYTSPEGEVITFSKAADDGTDISGDYTEYGAVSEETSVLDILIVDVNLFAAAKARF